MLPIPIISLICGLIISPVLYRWKHVQKPIYLALIGVCFYSLLFPFKSQFFLISRLNQFASFLFLLISSLVIFGSKPGKDSLLHFIVLTSLIAAALAANFFTFYVSIELLLVSCSFLILNPKFKNKSLAASQKYLLLNVIGSIFILLAIGFSLPSLQIPPTPSIAILAAVGLLTKSAIFPFHSWLVDAYSIAKSPASALLAGITTSIGIFGLFKFIPLQELSHILVTLALATSLYAAFTAIKEWNLKRLLAWSTLVHYGYILFAAALLTKTAFISSLFHLFNHGIAKSLVFLSAGLLITGKSDLRKLKGSGRSAVGICFLFGLLSLMAVPPFNCFLSELLILQAGISAGKLWLVIALLASYFLGLLWHLRILNYLFFKKSDHNHVSPSFWKFLPILLLAFLTLFIGLWPSPFLKLASNAAATLS